MSAEFMRFTFSATGTKSNHAIILAMDPVALDFAVLLRLGGLVARPL
jgi:hypothetical protein